MCQFAVARRAAGAWVRCRREEDIAVGFYRRQLDKSRPSLGQPGRHRRRCELDNRRVVTDLKLESGHVGRIPDLNRGLEGIAAPQRLHTRGEEAGPRHRLTGRSAPRRGGGGCSCGRRQAEYSHERTHRRDHHSDHPHVVRASIQARSGIHRATVPRRVGNRLPRLVESRSVRASRTTLPAAVHVRPGTRLLGLTGPAGSGKSTALEWLATKGAATLDADSVVRSVLGVDAHLADKICERFGPGVMEGGAVDRARLGMVVFADPAALTDLEALLHPIVSAHIKTWRSATQERWSAIEAVKLVESELLSTCDSVWLFLCEKSVRRERLAARGWSEAELTGRLASAPPLGPELAVAKAVIDTSGPWGHTVVQLEAAWAVLAAGESHHMETRP